MSITPQEATHAIELQGFSLRHSTSKISEFVSSRNGRVLYLRLNQGFPDHADVVVRPEADVSPLLAIDGVEPNSRVEFRHGSNMHSFPKRLNDGAEPEHYGRALCAFSSRALAELCEQYGRAS